MSNMVKPIENIQKNQKAQAMVETAFTIPILVLLFAGCVQLIQIGVANVVVYVAVYEAARQAHMDERNLSNGQKVAEEICRAISKGDTEFKFENSYYTVTHHLQPIIPVVKKIRIAHMCPDYIFEAGENAANDPQNP